MTHYVRFTRSSVTGETVATCLCGAMHTNDRDSAAEWAKHHLKYKGADRHKPLPELSPGFVSGLEKLD